jgi:hypothetical protein
MPTLTLAPLAGHAEAADRQLLPRHHLSHHSAAINSTPGVSLSHRMLQTEAGLHLRPMSE